MQQLISETIKYIGVDDKTLEFFEGQYPIANGVSYNSYLILDEKVAVLDTVDSRAQEEWFANLETALEGKTVDYVVVSHMEPDHGASVKVLMDYFPMAKAVGNAKTFAMMEQFFDWKLESDRKVIVKEGETLSLGSHTLKFFMAPMVHWPEVMVSYEESEKILFSADGFGKFGTSDTEEPWEEEAARYYLNIVGKYGAQVQALLKKAATLDIAMICPLHGPVLKGDVGFYVDKYQTWSTYAPEKEGILIACASIHGNTKAASEKMKTLLEEKGETCVEFLDLTTTDVSYAVRKAFYYDRMVVAGATYDGSVFPAMEEFLHHIKAKNYQKRTVGVIENGSWGPLAGKTMKGILETMKDVTILEPMVTIKSALNEQSLETMVQLADVLVH